MASSGYLQASSSPYMSVRATSPSPTAMAMSSSLGYSNNQMYGGTTHSTSGNYAASGNYGSSYGANYNSSGAAANYGNSGNYASQTMQSTVQSERIVSSNVVGEQQLSSVPEDTVQYVEVPVIEEKVKYVPKKEYVEVERRIPKYEYEWVDRIVEVPKIETVEKYVEVPHIEEIIRRVPKREVIDVPREVVRHVPKIETRIVEKVVNVPGEIIELEKKVQIENRVVVPRYTDREVPTVVAQSIVPTITESETDFVDVDLKEYNPYLVKVDVFVPRPVQRSLIATGRSDEHHVVDVPVEQFNALVKQLNTGVVEQNLENLLIKDRNGAVPIAAFGPGTQIVSPVSGVDIQGEHQEGQLHYYMSTSASTGPTMTTTTTTASRYAGGTPAAMYSQSTYGPATTTVSSTSRGIPSTSITQLGGSYTTTSGGMNMGAVSTNQGYYTTSSTTTQKQIGGTHFGGSSQQVIRSGFATPSRAF